MRRYMEMLSEVFKNYGDRIAFIKEDEKLTYRELDEESARIYSYLKEKKIGKEKFVTILFPRNIHFASCLIGVLKAGAAFVLIEEGYPAERVDYIRRDIDSAFVLDNELFKEIMAKYDPLDGYEETGLHDAAYAVYTSGSTGNPKGVLHEYGNLDQCALTSKAGDEKPEMSTGFVSPLNFVAAIISVINNTLKAATIHIISPEMLRNFSALTKYIEDQKLDGIYLPPSYIRLYKNPAPSLKAIPTGSEAANGIYYEGGRPAIVNTYSMSEAGFTVLSISLKHAYDVAPVGKPVIDIDIHLIDENGNRVEGEGQGELCFKNEYVRGYINLPEQTAKAFQNGIYHTGDICRRDADGVYYVVGRSDDMIKINGNRIEPAEIEAAVKRCTGLQNVVAKGFSERNRSYIALYFLKDEASNMGIYDGKELKFEREKLKGMLPSYMIPTYYVAIDSFPMNVNGKLSRKDLKAPKIEDNSAEYVAPEDEIQEYFCNIMAAVLDLDKVGIDDDFFLMGGDSMKAMMLVSVCENYALSSKDIYELRTPRMLAGKYASNEHAAITGEENEKALKTAYPLLAGQLQNVFYQEKAPQSNFLSLSHIIKLEADADTEKLAAAVNRAIKAHPALMTRIIRQDDGTYTQQYDDSFYTPVEVKEIQDTQLQETMGKFLTAFRIENSILYKICIYKAETAVYVFVALHHIITDGSGLKVLIRDILGSYKDESYEIATDYHFAILGRIEAGKAGKSYEDAKAYFKGLMDEKVASHSTQIGLVKDEESPLRRSDLLWKIDAFEREDGRGSNFFLAAALLAAAWFNGTGSAFMTSMYSRRDDKYRMASAGYLAAVLTVCLDTEKQKRPEDILKSVEEQVSYGIAHSEYCYLDDIKADATEMLRFNYEKDILKLNDDELKLKSESIMPGSISINVIDNEGADKLSLVIRYSKDNYSRQSMERYTELLHKAVEYLDN